MSKPHPQSPLAPAALPALPAMRGVRLATAQAGIRYKDRTDLLLVELAKGTTVAGVFTRSKGALGAGRLVPRAPQGRQGAGAAGQFRQCQCFHRQARRSGGEIFRPGRRQGAGLARRSASSSPRPA